MVFKDRIASICLLLFCTFFYILSYKIDTSNVAKLNAAFFPRFLLGMIAVLTIAMFIKTFFTAGKTTRNVEKNKPLKIKEQREWIIWAIFALFALYIYSLKILGFVISAFLFMLVLYLILIKDNKRNFKRNLFPIGGLFVIAVTLSFIFEKYLQVFLPKGLFF